MSRSSSGGTAAPSSPTLSPREAAPPSRDFQWGPTNPHPLSQRRTELVWDGKYDEYGNRREVDFAGLAMPMQKIETVDEPRQRAESQGTLPLWEKKGTFQKDFRNRLIWGDNKLVMASLLAEFKGKIDLIYIDPPFDVGADFTMEIPIGEGKETITKDQSTLEMVAYRDMWGKGTDSYLHMMYERLLLMRELLSSRGNLFVHLDYRVNSMIRLILDEVFDQCLVNEIIWHYNSGARSANGFGNRHDTILRYSLNSKTAFMDIEAPQARDPYSPDINIPASKAHYYHPLGKIKDDVWRIGIIPQNDKVERCGYRTQKPELLLEQIINVCCPPEGLIADFFCGSGTTGTVAERLGRRWIMADLGRFAIHTTRRRLLEEQRKLHDKEKPYRAFDVYNLGRYERQWWQKDRLQGAEEEHRRVVLEFFRAEVIATPSSPLLHGRKGAAFCHVDGIDGIFTSDEARQVVEAVVAAGGREVYCLAWEFQMELRQHCLALESEFCIRIKLVPIPREIMEKNRKSLPPFLEMALLEAEIVPSSLKEEKIYEVKLTRFLPSLVEVPGKELEALQERAIKSGFDFIDFWAIDFDWKPGEPFHHDWQDYRTRKDRTLKTTSDAGHVYDGTGRRTICVKVVDVFGCDTSLTLEVNP